MKKVSALAFLTLAFLLSGCLSLKLQTPDQPLSQRDLNLRHQTREFAVLYAEVVRNAADTIAQASPDKPVRDEAVRWKIAASQAVRDAALHNDPVLALADTWAFCRQVSDFFSRGPGTNRFGSQQLLATTNSQALQQRIEDVARRGLSAADFRRMEQAVADYADRFPLRDLSLDREPMAAHWTGLAGGPPKTTVGTAAEAMSDLADRVSILGRQVPEEMRWRVELGAGDLGEALERTREAADRLDRNLLRIAAVAESSPATVSNAVATAARELREGVLPSIDRLDKQWASTLTSLKQEREALARDIASERAALVTAFGEQRLAIMKEFDKTAREVTDRTLVQARAMLRDALFYGVLLVAVVLGLPFAFGFITGRMSARKSTRPSPTPSTNDHP